MDAEPQLTDMHIRSKTVIGKCRILSKKNQPQESYAADIVD